MKIEDIKVVKNEVPYSDLVNAVVFAANSSFAASTHEYHKYLQDYGEALAILVTFTNYEIGEKNEVELFDEVMQIRHSDKWENEIVVDLGSVYCAFVEYVDAEIEYRIRPFAKFDATLDSAKAVLDKVGEIAQVIDVDKLREFDMGSIIELLDGLNESKNTDNIVSINKE